MNQIVQVGVRRNGLHAVRRWIIQTLELNAGWGGPGQDSENEVTWFAWPTPARITDALIVTLESFPIVEAEAYAQQTGGRLVVNVRSMVGWMGSSFLLDRRIGRETVPLGEFFQCWLGHVNCDHLKILYEPWLLSRSYRLSVAKQLGALGKGGDIGLDSADQDVRHRSDIEMIFRGFELAGDPEFLEVLRRATE